MDIKTKRYYIYYIGNITCKLTYLLPIRFVSRLSGFLGKIAFYLHKEGRTLTLENLRACFNDKADKEIEKIAKCVFSNVSRNFAEYINIFKINKKNVDTWVRPYGLEKIDRAFTRGKGVIVLTAHFGNWEFVGAYLRIKGYEGAIIARRIYFHKYNDYLIRLRLIHDVHSIYRDEPPKKALKLLRENKVLGMLADQDIDSVDGVFVDFFGRPAYTPVAPVKIAMASSAPIIPCYMIRRGDIYDFIVEDPIFVEKGKNSEESVKFYTQKWTSVLESYIRRYPEQWVWMHRRWKTKPQ